MLTIDGERLFLDGERFIAGAALRQTAVDCRDHAGHLIGSTWLQCPPPFGPRSDPGGHGTTEDPGILWWLGAVGTGFPSEADA